MQSIEQAKWLSLAVSAALKELRKDWPTKQIDESEVSFRFKSVEGVLIMALNEAHALVEEWEAIESSPTTCETDSPNAVQKINTVCQGSNHSRRACEFNRWADAFCKELKC